MERLKDADFWGNPYYGRRVLVKQSQYHGELFPDFTGEIRGVLNDGTLIEVHPDNVPSGDKSVTFRYPVEFVEFIDII